MNDKIKICVTGAGGFVGAALCKTLLHKGFEVHGIARGNYPGLIGLGVILHKLDLSTANSELTEAFRNSSCVFHVASKVDMWGQYREFYSTNVTGTKNVIAACKSAGVPKLIYTSSPSVVADGSDLNYVDENYPIPKRHLAPYSATKAIAEREILAANSPELKTISLRPHLIFGPGDIHFIPTIIDRAKKGRLVIVGQGKNLVDVCFIEDCVQAHLCALRALDSNPSSSGKAYFISQGQAISLWEFINKVLEANGLNRINKKIPKNLALGLAAFFEVIAKLSPIEMKPFFTRFLVSEMTTNHYFNIQAARDLLGYHPNFSIEQAIEKSFSVL